MTCRGQYLSGNYKSLFTLAGKPDSFREIYLLNFSSEQMTAYVAAFAACEAAAAKARRNTGPRLSGSSIAADDNWTAEKYISTLEAIPGITSMCREPFSLKLILTILPRLTRTGQHTRLTRSDIYDGFTEDWYVVLPLNLHLATSRIISSSLPRAPPLRSPIPQVRQGSQPSGVLV